MKNICFIALLMSSVLSMCAAGRSSATIRASEFPRSISGTVYDVEAQVPRVRESSIDSTSSQEVDEVVALPPMSYRVAMQRGTQRQNFRHEEREDRAQPVCPWYQVVGYTLCGVVCFCFGRVSVNSHIS